MGDHKYEYNLELDKMHKYYITKGLFKIIEEKAIEELKNKKADYFMISNLTGKTLVNLIEKQFKEIKELKAHQIIFTNDYKPIGSKGRKFISEDKIKAKIEEVNIKLENYEADKINIFSGQTYMEKFKLLGELYGLQSLLEKE